MKKSLLIMLAATTCLASDPRLTVAGLEAMQSISAAHLKAHLTLLASDEFEGRETSFRGQKLSARYIASYFEQLGLQPLGDIGSFFQRFPLLQVTVNEKSYLSTATPQGARDWKEFGKEFIPSPSGIDTTVTGAIAFAGYGISSRELHYNDYDTSIDFHGRIVIILRGAPNEDDTSSIFFKEKRAVSLFAKRFYAQRSGAAGLMIVDDTKGRTMQEVYNDRLDNLRRGSVVTPSRARPDFPVFSISSRIANELLGPSGESIENLQRRIDSSRHPFAFTVEGSQAALHLLINRKETSAENVTALLKGSDSVLQNEYVVISAHYDHVGKNSVTGEVYNGADDDGSGTTSVLEIARSFAEMGIRPRRSIVFLTVAGEEKGLLGSSFYVDNPMVPLEKTISDLNIDMVGRLDPEHEKKNDSNYVYIIGSDKLSTDLHMLSEEANSESVKLTLDYTYNSDTDPNQFYRRSDHYNFAKKKIPVIFYFNGTHADYHQPGDEVGKIVFSAMEKRVRLVFYTAWKLANIEKRPVVDKEGFRAPASSPQ